MSTENYCCLDYPYLEYLEKVFPKSFPEIKRDNLINPNLFSPFVIDLPEKILNTVDKFVSKVYKIKDSSDYHEALPKEGVLENVPKTPSVLTCFDFHYTEKMGLKLIEINTNASLYLPIVIQGCAQGNHCTDPTFDVLLNSFINAFDLKKGDGISILDENPKKEGLYFEFLIFKEWLERHGYKSNIIGIDNYSKDKYKNVYNRYTDFYFKEEKSKAIKNDYYSGTVKFSPNPREYFLLADKRRLSVLRKFLAKVHPELSTIIPESKLFSEFESKDALWTARKKYFLKPSQSFGSKAVYSGKGISRKAFENIYSPNFMAQELVPAGRKTFTHEGQEVEMKFDLRFFTFEGKIQNYGARIYQGQVTNMRTPLGGITPIRFTT